MKQALKITLYIILLITFIVILSIAKYEFNIDLAFHILIIIITFNHKKIFNYLFN